MPIIQVRPRLVPAASGSGGGGAPAHVQSAYADTGSATAASQAVALPVPATAGNLIVVAGVSDATLTTSGMTGLGSPVASVVVINGVYLWAKVAAGGEQSVTLTPSVTDTVCAAVAEYSGIAASPLDVTVTANGTGSTVGPVSAGSTAATAQAVELSIALTGLCNFVAGLAPNTPVWSGGYTARQSGATTYTTGSQNQALFLADFVTSATGAQTTTTTWTNSANAYAAIIATFKGA